MNMRKILHKKSMFFLLFALPAMVFAQGTIQGTISDEGNLPIPGASVVVQGTTNGTTSDFDGNYELSIDSFPATLVISYLGYA